MKPGIDALDGRVACCIVDCGRTRPTVMEGGQWICGPHWRMLPKASRDDVKLLRRITKRKPTPAAIGLFVRRWEGCRDRIDALVMGAPEDPGIEAFLSTL